MEPITGPHGFPLWEKAPAAVKDYAIDWTPWLAGDTISVSTWDVQSGINMDSSGNTSTHAVIWLSSGTNGKSYLVTNKIVTSGGRTEVRTIEILVKKQ